ncbi:MAG TPA: hypothetical protein VFG44_00185 [Burkholderiales bacterium]|nr:hypothetical protein [Burkholderiales bacterium]
MRLALSLLALLFAVNAASAAESLGRLFYTPAERAQLDVLRSRKNVAAPEQQEPPPAPEVVTYGGVVRRSDGKTTVWINNQVVNDGKATDGLPISSRVRPDDSVSLKLPQASGSIDLKVGQSVEIGSGAIAEPYARGVRRARPEAAGSAGGPPLKSDTAAGAAATAARVEQDDERARR